MADAPTPLEPIPYANPSITPPDIAPHLTAARWCVGIGFLVPLVGCVGIIIGIATLNRPRVGVTDRKSAYSVISLGVLSIFLNPLLLCSLLTPSLGRAREPANRIKCSSNLRQIGFAIATYAKENDDRLPPDFLTLLLTQDITGDTFICASSADDRPPLPPGATLQQRAATILEGTPTCSYFYLPNLTHSQLTARHVLVYEKTTNHDGDGMNILFGDGHVDWIPKGQFEPILAELQAGQNPPPSVK